MNRTPPIDVRRQLGQEVGFGCPVEGCGSPYLTWNHFDPPWRERQHHEAAGMIALCREHHDKADAGAFTIEQLRDLKTKGRDPGDLAARFDWMRHQLLAVVGANFYLETPTPVQIGDRPIVWLRRDSETRVLLLNIDMPTTSDHSRMVIQDNWWITAGEGARSRSATAPRTGHSESLLRHGGQFPVTAVEVGMTIADTPISFGPRRTQVSGVTMIDNWVAHCPVGLLIG